MPDLVPIPSPGLPLYYGLPGSPLVIVAHDWYGRLPGLEPFATALAAQGYRVVVPDFYNGVCTVDAGDAETLMSGLDVASALANVDDIVREARSTGSTRIGLIGFSMGGYLALLYAQGGEADAVVSYYATLDNSEHGLIPCPVLLHLAEFDEWPDGGDPASFVARLTDHGSPVITHTYAGTQHSFANASIPELVDTNAAALAFARSVNFLGKHLAD
jgi:carboxymethylenebutenolidase